MKNPKCPNCGNVYDPRKIQIERTIFDSTPIPQWLCDKCKKWVNLNECEWVEEGE